MRSSHYYTDVDCRSLGFIKALPMMALGNDIRNDELPSAKKMRYKNTESKKANEYGSYYIKYYHLTSKLCIMLCLGMSFKYYEYHTYKKKKETQRGWTVPREQKPTLSLATVT